MGTDSVRLFDKAMADRILALDRDKMIRFIDEHLDALRHKDKNGGPVNSAVFYELKSPGGSVKEAVERLIAEKIPLRQLREELVYDLALGDEEIYLDYYGCYAEVFHEGDPKGSIPALKYFSDNESVYLLLNPTHVDRMIRSLKSHISELRVMDKADIGRLEYFRDFCVGHQYYWVAYTIDL